MDDRDKRLARDTERKTEFAQRRAATERFEEGDIPQDVTREEYIKIYISTLGKAYGSPRRQSRHEH